MPPSCATGALQQIAADVADRTDALFVVITDDHGIRLAHPDRGASGRGRDARPSPRCSRATRSSTGRLGTLGESARAKVPVYPEDGGAPVGEVSVGFERASVFDDLPALVATIAIAAIGGLALARRGHAAAATAVRTAHPRAAAGGARGPRAEPGGGARRRAATASSRSTRTVSCGSATRPRNGCWASTHPSVAGSTSSALPADAASTPCATERPATRSSSATACCTSTRRPVARDGTGARRQIAGRPRPHRRRSRSPSGSRPCAP